MEETNSDRGNIQERELQEGEKLATGFGSYPPRERWGGAALDSHHSALVRPHTRNWAAIPPNWRNQVVAHGTREDTQAQHSY